MWIRILLLLSFSISTKMFSQNCLSDISYPEIEIPSSVIDFRTPQKIFVVVHILYEKEEDNIPNEQVIRQIEALNRDFNLRNTEWLSLPPPFKNLATSANIEFCLAGIAPDGSVSTGITRTLIHSSNLGITGQVFYTDEGGKDAWLTDKYLNIWVTKMAEEILGFSSGPLDKGEPFDGVVINSLYFGTSQAKAPFQLGRTLVHEIGHFLGLNHPWGNTMGECEEDDNIIDTPKQKGPHASCPPRDNMGCEIEKTYWNFMDYTPDCCMALFTKGQVQLMHLIMEAYRPELISFDIPCSVLTFENTPLMEIVCFPNPTENLLWIEGHNKKFTEYFVFNSSGMLIEKGQFQSPLRLKHLASGIYYISLVGTPERIIKKVVVNRLVRK